jgi:hypothetical protein
MLLQRYSGDPGVEKTRAEFESLQKIEESFHRDFDEIDFTSAALVNELELANKL